LKIVDEALKFIKTRAKNARKSKQQQPYFMQLSFASPHDPHLSPPQFRRQYNRSNVALPLNYRRLHRLDNGAMLTRDELLFDYPRVDEEVCCMYVYMSVCVQLLLLLLLFLDSIGIGAI
jgi:hypothetical protein